MTNLADDIRYTARQLRKAVVSAFEYVPTSRRNTAPDPMNLLMVVFAVLRGAFIECYIPARRAAKVDSMVALRHE